MLSSLMLRYMAERSSTEDSEFKLVARGIPLWGWLAAIAYTVLAGALLPSEYEGWAQAAGWFVLGGMCIVHYRSQGRYHCKITGPGFFSIGTLFVLDTLGVVAFDGWMIGAAIIATLLVGFGLECRYGRYGSKEATCCGIRL
jgi:hypothetical protein